MALCTFNGDKYLAAQLQSLLDQTRRPDEIVICDDGSVDGTVDLIYSYQKKTDLPIKLLINKESLGVISNFEKAISHCTGDIIFLCDQDDIWYTKKIATMAAILQDDESVSLVASNNRLIDSEAHPIGSRLNWELCGFTKDWQDRVNRGDAFRVFSFHSPISGHAMAFRRSICPVLLPFPQGYHHDRWVAMICAGVGNVRLISEPLSDYRQHDHNIVGGGILSLRC
ncbi:MAG: glycosyltransferase family 2 protein [Phycisphaerales bacterium]|nr:glycosyltransferase family 2 protein [Phycisphaerales bacterium]